MVEETGSTNTDLVARAAAGEAAGVVLAAEFQSGGRGRLDRSFSSPPRSGLLFSSLVSCDGVPSTQWSWLPLLAGLAVREAVRSVALVDAVLKWPNDVLIAPGGGKVCGILVQAVPGREQAVIGIGINVTMSRDELPVPTATSLLLEGAADVDRTALWAAVLVQLGDRLSAWRGAAGDPAQSGLLGDYVAACTTIGQQVRVQELSGAQWTGQAVGIDGDGRLEVLVAGGGATRAVGAGDVMHLRAT